GAEPVQARQTPFFKNSLKSARRIDNIKRDLALLAERPLTMKFHLPAPPLNPFIESIIYCKDHNLGHSFERTLPDGSAQLQIVIGEGGREMIGDKKLQPFRKALLMGMNSAPITYRLGEMQHVIYVRFRPYGLYAFTKINQAELHNQVVDASLVFGSSIENLWETLAMLPDPAQMISCVEDFFTGKLIPVVSMPDLLAYMLHDIHLPLTRLAKKAGYSDKYLTKTFQKYIGVGPKVFQRIKRFQGAVRDMNQFTESIDWADLVFQHGYHDQAHFIKEFKDFTGLSPQNYLSMAPSCTRYLHGSDLLDRGI
ncbi:MAG TPA: helix-turn-helix domain-containing protein, partial [Chryseolinea sp.]